MFVASRDTDAVDKAIRIRGIVGDGFLPDVVDRLVENRAAE
jgi:hypothetical protein